jgi:2-alkyl-3-oxoalkanoate reductase
MRVLLTGATGFIGSHLAELLLDQGWDVVCLTRNPRELKHVAGKPFRAVDLPSLEAEIRRGDTYDYVIHLAGATRGLTYDSYYRANVDLTRTLLELCSTTQCASTLRRFVLVSSQAAVGPSAEDGTPVTESTSCKPVSLYGRSKLEAERVATGFMDRLPMTVIRPPTVFGPRDVDVLGVFRSARFRLAPCLAGPDRLVSIIYVEDLVGGILKACLAEETLGETYFLANPQPVVWREFAVEVARVMGYRALVLPIPLAAMKAAALAGDVAGRLSGKAKLFRTEKLEEMRQLAWVCSPDKAFRHMGWQTATPLDEAIRKTVRWYRTNGWI